MIVPGTPITDRALIQYLELSADLDQDAKLATVAHRVLAGSGGGSGQHLRGGLEFQIRDSMVVSVRPQHPAGAKDAETGKEHNDET